MGKEKGEDTEGGLAGTGQADDDERVRLLVLVHEGANGGEKIAAANEDVGVGLDESLMVVALNLQGIGSSVLKGELREGMRRQSRRMKMRGTSCCR